ncbi:MAG: class I mannose-6-phosphate isomerase [Phycisphaerae bacterium]|nr:class I mannose-6-phosphate isomerase [Phycisphaerae bacterium]
MNLYPLKFKPIYKERIWGGRALHTVFGKDLPTDAKIGESWELADLPEDRSVVTNGPLAGKTLRHVATDHTEALTGKAEFPLPFPLLIKLLDAQDVLSVQVHPDQATCDSTGQGDPKTECWYVVHAEPGACIYKGLVPGVTRVRFREAIENGTVEDLLIKVPVTVGECHFLPTGTVHAIGAGLLIAEIQQPSDTTYRVFDWNRVDDQGKARELHIDLAIESIHFDASGDHLTTKSVGRLADCDFFTVDKKHQMPGTEMLISSGELEVHVILSGQGQYVAQDQQVVPYKAGDTILIPACYNGVMRTEAETSALAVSL